MKNWLIEGHPQTKAVTLLVRIPDCNNNFVCFPERIGKPDLYYQEGDLSFPAGHIRRDREKTLDTAVRELLEETNLSIAKSDLSALGTYSFIKKDRTLVHVTVLEGEVTDEQWTRRLQGVELFRPADLVFWPRKCRALNSTLNLRITTIYPALVLKYGRSERVQQLLADHGMPSHCAIHHKEPDRSIFIDPVAGKLT